VRALFALFQEKRYPEDVKSGRVCQPPTFYEAWNRVIDRLEQVFAGAEDHALPQMYASFNRTLAARTASHNAPIDSEGQSRTSFDSLSCAAASFCQHHPGTIRPENLPFPPNRTNDEEGMTPPIAA
jgi:hypothetical protein